MTNYNNVKHHQSNLQKLLSPVDLPELTSAISFVVKSCMRHHPHGLSTGARIALWSLSSFGDKSVQVSRVWKNRKADLSAILTDYIDVQTPAVMALHIQHVLDLLWYETTLEISNEERKRLWILAELRRILRCDPLPEE